MAIVIIVSQHAGVELVFAVLRGMLAFLAVRWMLGAVVEVLELAGFGGHQRERAGAPARQNREPATAPASESGATGE
jgi:hypothetical protein